MNHRPMQPMDLAFLAQWNHQLIEDEGHRNPMSVAELEQRMKAWLEGEYRASIFELSGEVVAYALFRETADDIHLRQLFVARHHRREGIGREAVRLLREEVWPPHKRLTVDVLIANHAAVAFWREIGFRDYCLTLEVMPAP